jgi:hypothetical protein
MTGPVIVAKGAMRGSFLIPPRRGRDKCRRAPSPVFFDFRPRAGRRPSLAPREGERSAGRCRGLAQPLERPAAAARHACEACPSRWRSGKAPPGAPFAAFLFLTAMLPDKKPGGLLAPPIRAASATLRPRRVQPLKAAGHSASGRLGQDLPSAGLRAPPAGAAPAAPGCPVSARCGRMPVLRHCPLRRSASGIVSGDAPSRAR